MSAQSHLLDFLEILKAGKGYALLHDQAAASDGPKSTTLYLYDFIGADFMGQGLTASRVVDDLAAMGDTDALTVRINSPGGDVFDGLAIYNALVRFHGKVTVHVDGLAASIASLVAMAGDVTVVAENAMIMVHPPHTIVAGDADEMRRIAGTLDKAWSALLTTYSRRTGRRAATIAQRVTAAGGEWWMTAEEAVAEGFADKVEKATKDAQVFGLSRFHKVPAKLAASAVPDPAVPRLPQRPEVAEVAAPRVTGAPRDTGTSAASRRRTLDLLRAAT